MNVDLMRKWVEALRSGKYKQGRGYLRSTRKLGSGADDSRYCCLGVLCDLVDPGAWRKRDAPGWVDGPVDGGELLDVYGVLEPGRTHPNSGYWLPQHIQHLVDLPPGQESYLAFANDDDGETFKQIADRIEKLIPSA